MSLRRNTVTPKSLAARRNNALKSTGPRSRRGKARVCLNALKHGRYAVLAARSARLRDKLLEAGHTGQEALYGAIRSRIAQAQTAQVRQDPAGRCRIDRMALRIWCVMLRTHPVESKLKSSLISASTRLWAPTECRLAPCRHTLVDRWTRTGLVFWRQRRRRSAGVGHWHIYENAIRCRRFRLAKPGAIERERFRLLANGDPDWNLEPWKSLKGDEWAKWPRPKERPWG